MCCIMLFAEAARTRLPTGVMAELSLRNQQSDWRSSYALEACTGAALRPQKPMQVSSAPNCLADSESALTSWWHGQSSFLG